jgi:hypothetical protein
MLFVAFNDPNPLEMYPTTANTVKKTNAKAVALDSANGSSIFSLISWMNFKEQLLLLSLFSSSFPPAVALPLLLLITSLSSVILRPPRPRRRFWLFIKNVDEELTIIIT